MDILAQFEYPLPSLSLDINEIDVETAGEYEGSFFIRNTGGGRLSGQITSYNENIVFTPETFDGPRRISYRITTDKHQIGDIIRTGAVILSNGGEKYLPITVQVNAASIITAEGIRVTNVRQFADYARQYMDSAAALLSRKEFRMLLSRTNFEFLDIYDHVISDPDKSRALDCFLRLSGLKKAARVFALQKEVIVKIAPFQREKDFGRIPIQVDGWGYIKDQVFIRNNSPWLKVLSNIKQAIEDSNMLTFCVDPTLISNHTSSDAIHVGPDSEARVIVIRQPVIAASLNKETYAVDEDGLVLVNNYSGIDLLLDIEATESCVHFDARGHYVSEIAKIPFYIRPTTFQAMSYKRQPEECFINIRAVVKDELLFRRLKLTIGDYQ
jgi:hypothetical protein